MKNRFFLLKRKLLSILILLLIINSNVFPQTSYETFLYKDYGLKNMAIGLVPNDANIGDKIYKDSKNNIWVYGGLGLKKYQTFNLTISKNEEYLKNKLTTSICEDKKGNVLVGSNGALFIYDGVTWIEKKVKGNITAMYCDDEGNVWIACRGLLASSILYKLSENDFIEVTPIDGVIINIIGNSTNIMLGVQHFTSGYSQFDDCDDIYSFLKKSNDYVKLLNSVNRFDYSLSVTSSFIDKNENFWFGTKILSSGISSRSPCLINFKSENDFKVYGEKDKENSIGFGSMVTSIIDDDHGNIWVGTCGLGLYKYENNTWTRFSTEDGLADNLIVGLIYDNDLIYIYTKKGLTIYKTL